MGLSLTMNMHHSSTCRGIMRSGLVRVWPLSCSTSLNRLDPHLRSLLSELELEVYFLSQWPSTKEVNVVREVEKIDGVWRFLTLASSIQRTSQKQKCSYFGIVMTQNLFQIFGAIFMWRIWPKIQQIFKTNKTKVICANSRFEF